MPSICFFVFNVTPPTEIYTYAHTLSLLDALPILERGCDLGGLLRLIAGQFQRGGDGAAMVRHEAGGRIDGEGMDLLRGRVGDFLDRSEEHTSELQSLMRISYAVFCLNKKIINVTQLQKR